VTSIKVNADTSGSSFPGFSFCNMNPFSTQFGYNFSTAKINEFKADLGLPSLPINREDLINLFRYTINMNVLAENSTVRSKFWNPIKNVVVSCFFNLEECDLENDFDSWYDNMYGLCYRFKTSIAKNSKIKKSGAMNGLSLKVLLGEGGYESQLASGRGLHLYLHNVRFLFKIHFVKCN